MHAVLVKHRRAVGHGYVNLWDYYLATLLAKQKDWFNKAQISLWSKIESEQIPGKNLLNNLLLYTSYQQTPKSPTMLASLKAWQ